MRARRAVDPELQNEDSVLEEGDLSRLETSGHDQERVAVAELQNLRWLEIPLHDQGRAGIAESKSRDCVARPWGLQWVMMYDQA
jgi:hypothetical protein